MGYLNFVESEKNIFNNFDALFVNGHTEAQMIPHIKYKDKTIVFMGGFTTKYRSYSFALCYGL